MLSTYQPKPKMKTTLTTPNDVVTLSGFAPGVPVCELQELYNIEFKEARRCLGFDLWSRMVDALASYDDAPEYTSGTTYAIGDVVKWRGEFSMATVETTAAPDIRSDWGPVPKFTGDAAAFYDTLYCSFMGPYLSLTVIGERLPFIWSKVQSVGVVQYDGGEFKTVDTKAYDRLLSAIHRNRNNVFANMVYYIERVVDGKELESATSDQALLWLDGWPDLPDETTAAGCTCNGSGCKTCKRGRKVSQRYRFG